MTESYDCKVDTYSFGVVLYEMLTLKKPEHLRVDLTNMLLHHTLISKLLKGYQSFFVEVVEMCVYRNKDRRYHAKDIENYMNKVAQFKVREGPVISKEDLKELREEQEEEDFLGEFESDTEKQKEMLREMKKEASIMKPQHQKVPSLDTNIKSTESPKGQKSNFKTSFLSPRNPPAEKGERGQDSKEKCFIQ